MRRIIRSALTILICIGFAVAHSSAEQQSELINGIKVYKSIGRWDLVFRHFEFALTPENILLPNNPKVVADLGLSRNPDNYRYNILDEKSDNFRKGQFAIYVPVDKFPLVDHESGYMIVRMPQTLTGEHPEKTADAHVKQKQALYNRIKEMVESKKGKVVVVLEFPYTNSKTIERNVDFRCAHGQYIDYVGQLRTTGL